MQSMRISQVMDITEQGCLISHAMSSWCVGSRPWAHA